MQNDVVVEVRRLIAEAVNRHRNTPNSAVLLSGGIDSSTVAAHAPNLPTVTGYYDGEAYDERRWANRAAHIEHHEIRIVPDDFVTYFDAMLEAAEPPYQGPGTFGQYMVAKRCHELGFTTMLSGEGGDELFGGYCRLLLVAGWTPPDGYENYTLPDDYPDTVEEALAYDYERLPDLLRVDDQMTKANGIKAVAPMAESEELVEYVLALPADLRVGKQLLRVAMRGIVPDSILERTDKRGFPVPYVEWAQGPIRGFVEDSIGYVPDPGQPWDRQWWLDLCEARSPVPA
jgi:asparagine synthetase B (glutamine-hydrolysing)